MSDPSEFSMAAPSRDDRRASAMRREIGRLLGSVSRRRAAFALAVCTLVSTQVFFQPMLFDGGFDAAAAFFAWLDYFGECVLMTVPILLFLAVAERLASRRSATRMTVAAALAIAAGAVTGACLLIPYYGESWTTVMSPRFWVDVWFWTMLGIGVAAIYGLQRRVAATAQALHQSQVDQVALSKQMLEARLQVMRAQIEPHFLFNTLANVKRLCRTDVTDGRRMLDNLIRYLRSALPQLRDAQTTLGQEADLVEAYLAVLKIRMGARLDYRIRVPREARDVAFPPMLLLTLVENSIKHGLNPSPEGGEIRIDARARGDFLDVSVADTGVGFGVAATGGTGVGLANSRARLSALHGDASELTLEANAPHGVVATVRLSRATSRPGVVQHAGIAGVAMS
jgi:hypothetical protein